MINQSLLVGYLGKDPRCYTSSQGLEILKFTVFTTEKKENLEFHNCVAFGKTAETIINYGGQKMPVVIIGRLVTQRFKDKQNVEKKITEINVDKFQMVISKAQCQALGIVSFKEDGFGWEEKEDKNENNNVGNTTSFGDDTVIFREDDDEDIPF